VSQFDDPSDSLKSVLSDLRKIAEGDLEESEAEAEEGEQASKKEGPIPLEILRFFHRNPNPSDDEFHRWAKSKGMEPDDAEEIAYRFVTEFSNFVFGGKSRGKLPEDLDLEQLSKGIEVELEHTPNRGVSAKIALDHLMESPIYYDALAKMEASLHGGATNT
jgi:hypothetical protein